MVGRNGTENQENIDKEWKKIIPMYLLIADWIFILLEIAAIYNVFVQNEMKCICVSQRSMLLVNFKPWLQFFCLFIHQCF